MTVRVRREAIRELRHSRGWTQEQLAEEAGLAARTVQRAEIEGVVSLRTFGALATAFDVEAHRLEFRTDRVDFGPVLMEIKILMLAITRHLMPLDDRDLPNSLVALFAVIAFSASFTLISAIVTIAGQSGARFDDAQTLAVFALALGFAAFFAGIVYPLFRLRPWARLAMLTICWCFLAINMVLLAGQVLQGQDAALGRIAEYVFNLAVTAWMYRVLTRGDIERLYRADGSPQA